MLDLTTMNSTPPQRMSEPQPLPDSEHGADGRTLGGRFELLELLGWGSTGPVYLACDQKDRASLGNLQVRVALHVIDRVLATDPRELNAIMQQVDAAQRIDHPAAPKIYEWVNLTAVSAVSAEYLPGIDVGALRARRSLRAPQVVAILLETARALRQYHLAGLSHFQLTPGNVLLQADGQLRLLPLAVTHGADSPAELLAWTDGLHALEAQGDAAARSLAALGHLLLYGNAPWRPTTARQLVKSLLPPRRREQQALAALIAETLTQDGTGGLTSLDLFVARLGELPRASQQELAQLVEPRSTRRGADEKLQSASSIRKTRQTLSPRLFIGVFALYLVLLLTALTAVTQLLRTSAG